MVESGSPENCYGCKAIEGSNPSASANKIMIKFFKKTEKEPESLKEVLSYLKKITEDHKQISRELADFKKESKKNLQKVGIIRFNPFKEVGGDQSFSLAVLHAMDNGFVVTSLYSHDGNRVYAKPIEKGVSIYSLSKEERKVLDKAMGA